MSGILLTWNLDDQAIIDSLKGVADMDMTPVADGVGEYMTSRFVGRLKEQITFDGKAFKQSQRAKDDGGLTLVDSGDLRNDYSLFNTKKGGQQVQFGSNLSYAAIHHFGGTTGRGGKTKIEANPILGVNADDDAEIGNIYLDHINKAAM